MQCPLPTMADEEGWEVVTSKKTVKRAKTKENREKDEQSRRERDLKYLHMHGGFQKHRMTRNKAIRLIADKEPEGTLFIMSRGRCVGHLIAATPKTQRCLECDQRSRSEFFHCCCSDDVKTSLPPNFYLGCDGYLDDYLRAMNEL